MYSDKELIEHCLANDPRAQEFLYKRFSRRMYGVCLRFARNTLEADDILQEGFIKVFAHLKDFRCDGSLEGWVRRVIVNTAINYYNSRLHELNETPIDKAVIMNSTTEDILDKISAGDLLHLIQGLPEGYRMVFNLYVIEGYNHQEIAEMLKISENTSKSQLSRARTALQERLAQRK
ncbi:MAG TPA: sigma-70 family RNA polymerase sigma factor [Bacteroidales bacterium]|jgi:RNA polymerase sigma-70 factor (ECF subfamily)|nr:sigma-70 family RNA polymerase sigma factor [Bacteroidales bacterium]MDX9906104.1 sigma-70 family RNA polymerase sigma factor [Bacteroidales bacterium]HNQ83119.1 sigma-70 family RNA polymerase sigma factor [Bacteroidales bacterium]HOX78982.1 sigma-70 family RNA polymerase sigma factor [Bacteroidales bacterium]HPI87348.1 sigma-70 family RNA polymerase sigma factor [Bacteroidales bacterium]